MRALAGMLTKGEGAVSADPPRALALLKQAIAAGDVTWGAYGLGDFYRADTPLKDAAKAHAVVVRLARPADLADRDLRQNSEVTCLGRPRGPPLKASVQKLKCWLAG